MLNQTQFLELFHQRTGASAGFVLMVAHVSRKDSSQLQRGVLAFWPCSAFQRKPVWVRGPGGRTLRDNIKWPRELQLWKELWSCILSEFPLIPVFLFPCSPLLAANRLFFRTVSVHSFPQRFLFFFFYLPHPPFRTSPPLPSPGKSPGFPHLSPEFFHPCIPFSLHILLHAAHLWEEANKNYREKETPFLL